MSDKYSETESSVRSIAATLWGIARGTLDSIRLSAAERTTMLFSAIAIAAISTILGSATIFFLSIGAAQLLKSVTPYGAYFIVAGFYILLLVILFIFRRRIIIDPIARLITRLLIDAPEEPDVAEYDDNTQYESNPTSVTGNDQEKK